MSCVLKRAKFHADRSAAVPSVELSNKCNVFLVLRSDAARHGYRVLGLARKSKTCVPVVDLVFAWDDNKDLTDFLLSCSTTINTI
mmetsp:Transcript_10610/g.19913  ORF Transcript_10610/g.19913 Transcript_10610/m.19913 type:complete len:85 (+) Transcript_10610:7276-7530(+)